MSSLLTHPRNLDEPEVRAAACRASDGDADCSPWPLQPSGEVAFNELRHGLPLRLGRFASTSTSRRPSRRSGRRRASGAATWSRSASRSASAPAATTSRSCSPSTHDGEHLLAGLPHGMLLLMRRDGTEHELLPRVLIDGRLLTDIHSILGVAGGFVVTGALPGTGRRRPLRPRTRQPRAYAFAAAERGTRAAWSGVTCAACTLLLLRLGDHFHAVRLATGQPRRAVPAAPALAHAGAADAARSCRYRAGGDAQRERRDRDVRLDPTATPLRLALWQPGARPI